MTKLEWAKKEIDIAMSKEAADPYACGCYNSALKAFESLLNDEHSGLSIAITKWILNRFIDGKPLTPIYGNDENEWQRAYTSPDGTTVYRNYRMGSLFKDVHKDGHVTYKDVSRVVNVDVDSNTTWHNGLCSRYIDERFPIEMPYYPDSSPYKVYTEDFTYKKPDAVGEYDHKALLYFKYPDGREEKIGKYYKEVNHDMVEITREEYYQHKEETK